MSESKPVVLIVGTSPGKSTAMQMLLGMKKCGLMEGAPVLINDLKFADRPTLSEHFIARGVQCGKSQFQTALFKQFISEQIYQHPYRHMWE